MKLASVLAGAVAACVLFAGDLSAQVRFPGDSPSRPFYLRGPSARVTRSFTIPRPYLSWRSRYYGSGVITGYSYSPGSLVYGYPAYRYPAPYFSSGYCPGCGGYGSLCGCGPLVYPPLVVDAGELYGPRALMKFFGADDNFGFAQPAPRAQPQAPPAGMAPAPARPRVAARPVNAGIRARAWKFIDHGDRHFREGRYREALSRYKKAIASDPKLAEAHLREAFAHLGLGNLDRAGVSLRRGLDRDPQWPASDFVLEDLFTDDGLRRAVFAGVADHLRALPNDSEARFLAGVLLHFDCDPEAAEQQFRRALKIAGADPAVRLFMPEEPEGE